MSDVHEDEADQAEIRRHSENVTWRELVPKLWNVAGMALLVVAAGVAFTSGWGLAYALLPLAGAAFAFYEANITQNQLYLDTVKAEADVRSEQDARNFWEAQAKVKNRSQDSTTMPDAQPQEQSHGENLTDALPREEARPGPSGEKWANNTPQKSPVKPAVERNANQDPVVRGV